MTSIKPKIRIGMPYPNHGTISPETRRSLDALKGGEWDIDLREIQCSIISFGRNAGVNGGGCDLVRQSGFDFDFYLSLDADIAFTPEHLRRLISRDKDIVGGAYAYRVDPGKIVAGRFNSDGIVDVASFLDSALTGLRQVDWIGAGFTLVKREVFEKTEYPWYHDSIRIYGNDCARAAYIGEDIGFCMGAARAGFDIYCDCDCRVDHITAFNPRGGFAGKDAIIEEKKQICAERERVEAAIAQRNGQIDQLAEEVKALTLCRTELTGQLAFADKVINAF